MFAAPFMSFKIISGNYCRLLACAKTFSFRSLSLKSVNVAEVQSLNQLIHEITRDEVVQTNIRNTSTNVYRILKTESLTSLTKICEKLEKPLSGEVASAVLEKLAKLNNKRLSDKESGLTFLNSMNKELLVDIGKALNSNITLTVIFDALSALLNLGIDKGEVFDKLFSLLKEKISSNSSDVQINQLVKFTLALRNSEYKLTEELQHILHNLIQLKTSEVSKPSEALFLMANCYVSPAWFDFLLERVKELLPLMQSGDLISLVQQMANRRQSHSNLLALVTAALTSNSTPLRINQLTSLANSIAVLNFTDARLLRKVANDVILNSNSLQKWSHITSIAVPFAKMHFGHQKAWEVLTSWMNNNYKRASIAELSRAITACAVCDKGYLVKEAAEYLAKNLNIQQTSSPSVWLNTVYALAICEVLTPQLAETVLRPEFLEQFVKEKVTSAKVFNFSRIAQIQAYVQCFLRTSYRGPSMKLQDYLSLNKDLNDTAAVIKYGSRGVYDADLFHNVLYKLAPLNSHAIAPFLSSDGYFVDGVVQLDKNSRFLRIEDFDSRKGPVLALIFLSSKQLTVTCDASEEAVPLGGVSLGIRVLKQRGMVPVTFTELEIQSKKYLAQKIEFVKNKLLEAANKIS